MNSQQVHKILQDKIPHIQNHVSLISHGGCGQFALELSRAIRAQGKRCAVVLINRGYRISDVTYTLEQHKTKDINTAWCRILEGGGGNLCNGHLAVKYGNSLYDDSGLIKTAHAISEPINDKTLSKSLNYGRHWNDTFVVSNRGKDTQDIFKQFLNKVLKGGDIPPAPAPRQRENTGFYKFEGTL